VSATPADWQTKAASGANLVLEDGTYTGTWKPAAGQVLMARSPGKAIFDGQGKAQGFVLPHGGDGPKLLGVKVQNYMRVGDGWKHGLPAVVDTWGMNEFEIGWCDIGHTDTKLIQLGGWTHVHDSYLHDAAEFCLHSGWHSVVDRVEAWNSGMNTPLNVPSGDKGFMKVAKSPGGTMRNLTVHDCRIGPWWDINNRNVVLEDFYVYDIPRMGVFLEISYGPMTVRNGLIRNTGNSGNVYYEGAVPAGLLISLTPDISIDAVRVENSQAGIINLQWNHPNTFDPDWSRLGLQNNVITNCHASGIKGSAFGVVGTYQAGTRPVDVTYRDCTYDSGTLRTATGAKFENVRKV